MFSCIGDVSLYINPDDQQSVDSYDNLRPSNKINAKVMNDALEKSDANALNSGGASYIKKVNQELSIKYNRQREFVSLAAHELRSPILPILGTLELIEYEFEESERKRDYIEKRVL